MHNIVLELLQQCCMDYLEREIRYCCLNALKLMGYQSTRYKNFWSISQHKSVSAVLSLSNFCRLWTTVCKPMFTHACIPMYTHVYPCIPMYTHVYTCSPMYTHVYPCIPMYTHVYPRIPMYTHVYPCIHMFTHVYPCIPMYTHI